MKDLDFTQDQQNHDDNCVFKTITEKIVMNMLRDESHRYTRDEILNLWTGEQVDRSARAAYKYQLKNNSEKFSRKVNDIERVLKSFNKGLIRLRQPKKDGDGTTSAIISIKINQPGVDDHLVNDDIEHQHRQSISKVSRVAERAEYLQSKFRKTIQSIRNTMTGINDRLEEE